MRARVLATVVLVCLSLTGCQRLLGATRPSNAKAKKDCAACARMCEVAGDAEKSPAAVESCKEDCKRTCQ